ncbi:MAG: AsmA-like C-terminal domain-containing protein, partial [Acetobacteraceae bacterium]
LTLTATFADAEPGRPLSGTAEIDDFRLRNAPVIGKLLEAVTLYGLVEALRGPGVGFSRLIAPFRLENQALRINEARMFSASLGLTADGVVDLGSNSVDLQGTVVPAYFFNSLLGRVPVLGRLFSPEQGGGVISVSYAVRGPVDDPLVTVNPLTALTPGLLRRLFGIF